MQKVALGAPSVEVAPVGDGPLPIPYNAPPMDPTLVLFDVDGTLVDCAGAGRRALEAAFRSVFGLDDVENLSKQVRFEGKTDPVIMVDIARAASIEPARYAREKARVVSVYLEALRHLLSSPDPRRRVLPGIRRLLDTLDAMKAVHIGLLTGNLEAGARAKLEPFGLAGYFPAGGFSSDHEDRNEIARIATEKFRQRTGFEFAPDRIHVVGDTELDVECARANGYRAVAVASGWVSAQRLREAAPDAFFDDLTDLPRVLRALGLDGRSP